MVETSEVLLVCSPFCRLWCESTFANDPLHIFLFSLEKFFFLFVAELKDEEKPERQKEPTNKEEEEEEEVSTEVLHALNTLIKVKIRWNASAWADLVWGFRSNWLW